MTYLEKTNRVRAPGPVNAIGVSNKAPAIMHFGIPRRGKCSSSRCCAATRSGGGNVHRTWPRSRSASPQSVRPHVELATVRHVSERVPGLLPVAGEVVAVVDGDTRTLLRKAIVGCKTTGCPRSARGDTFER